MRVAAGVVSLLGAVLIGIACTVIDWGGGTNFVEYSTSVFRDDEGASLPPLLDWFVVMGWMVLIPVAILGAVFAACSGSQGRRVAAVVMGGLGVTVLVQAYRAWRFEWPLGGQSGEQVAVYSIAGWCVLLAVLGALGLGWLGGFVALAAALVSLGFFVWLLVTTSTMPAGALAAAGLGVLAAGSLLSIAAAGRDRLTSQGPAAASRATVEPMR
ncbi:hypothetical protein [Blastococcus sp. Marseille-P5729]|uniref:hypothetical protein n=1 Tax=Blastococcus sp. Marseille-P5729 TaxID=2086582 RepID=UPI00131BE67D|nr:hypothetical protein [Blastococcus sp. Marseille-P5729]